MISKKMEAELNIQLNREFYSAYLYLAMSAYCSKKGFNGAANWFSVQYQEEIAHAMKMFNYIKDQDAEVVLEKIDAPESDFNSILAAFEDSLAHERKMTTWLNELSDLAMKEKDHATYNMLQWYVTEQVEEEATVSEIIDKMKIVGDNGYGLYSIDQDLATRTFVDPTAA